jgi:hypothetical protein
MVSKLRRIIEENNIKISDYDVFIETGIYLGDTLRDLFDNNNFDGIDEIFSIEIEMKYIELSLSRHSILKEDNRVNIIHGDSYIEIPKIIENRKNKRILFWLDAHFSGGPTGKSQKYGECPVMGELDSLNILKEKPIIIIDDVTFFIDEEWENGNILSSNHNKNDWPDIEKIKNKIRSLGFDFQIKINKELAYIIAY